LGAGWRANLRPVALPLTARIIRRFRTAMILLHLMLADGGSRQTVEGSAHDEACDKSGTMNLRHAAALALVGWYLMVPPTQVQLDSTCRSGPSVMDHVTALIGRDDVNKVHARRCDQEGIEVALDAPLSAWSQSGEFETLKECKVEQQKPMTEQDRMQTALALSVVRESGVTKDALMSSVNLARESARCVASDDPRLKGN